MTNYSLLYALRRASPHWQELAERYARQHAVCDDAIPEAAILAVGRLQLLLEEGRRGLAKFNVHDLVILTGRAQGDFATPCGSFCAPSNYLVPRWVVDETLMAKYEMLSLAQRLALDDLIEQAWHQKTMGLVEGLAATADRMGIALAA